jgi:hypothetical protein
MMICPVVRSTTETRDNAFIPHDEYLPRPVRADRFNRCLLRGFQSLAGLRSKAKARRYAVLEHFETHGSRGRRDFVRLVVVVAIIVRPVRVAMIVALAMAVMMSAAAQQPRAGDVDGQAQAGNRNRLSEVDRNRRKETGDRFVADFGHHTDHSAACTGDQMHHLFAARLAVERALDRFDLAPDAAHARQQLGFLTDRMRRRPILYPPILYKPRLALFGRGRKSMSGLAPCKKPGQERRSTDAMRAGPASAR